MTKPTDKTAGYLDSLDLGFVNRIRDSLPGKVVGFLSTLLKDPRLRGMYREVLETPIMALNRPVQKGQVIENREVKFHGGFGSFQGRPMIFVNPYITPTEIVRTLFEEGAHALRRAKGRPLRKQDLSLGEFDEAAYRTDPEEVSAKRMMDYAMGIASGKGKTASPAPPESVARMAQQMLQQVKPEAVGGSRVVEGWWVETHTLGCRNAADEPEEKWWDSHFAIYDEYMGDGISTVLGEPDTGKFVTMTPQRGTKTAGYPLGRQWLGGDCDLFALALSERMPDAEFVGVFQPGTGLNHHIALRRGNRYFDARGGLFEEEFLRGLAGSEVRPIGRDDVVGYYNRAWVGHEDELRRTPEMKAALGAVQRVYGHAIDVQASADASLFDRIVREQGIPVEADQGLPSAVLRRPVTLSHSTYRRHVAPIERGGLLPRSRGRRLYLGLPETSERFLGGGEHARFDATLAAGTRIYDPQFEADEIFVREPVPPGSLSRTAGQLPSVSFRQVWHVGSMDPKGKGEGSLEGAGLSVSTHPEEWQQIAELGSGPVWELARNGNRFLDFHRLTKAQRSAMADWGVQQGLVERRPAWQVRWWDSEDRAFRYMEAESEEEAKAEAEPVGGKVKALSSVAYPTARLRQATRNPRASSVVAMDLLATVYADKALGWDGVWWQDTLDVPGLSAPRGVIFSSRLPGWQRRQVRMGEIEDYGAPGRKVSGRNQAYPVTSEWIAKAREFLLEKWSERVRELGRKQPADLSGACKFSSLFGKEVFGLDIQGNWDHQFNVLPDGSPLDLGEQGDSHEHDEEFFGNPEHRESMKSCMPRVRGWAEEFRRRYPLKQASRGPSPRSAIPSFEDLVRRLGGIRYLLAEVDIDKLELEDSEKTSEDYIRGKFDRVRSFFAGLSYPIPVYRAVSGSRRELRTRGFGTSWSMSEGGGGEQGAYPYQGNPSNYQVYSSHVSPEDINWTTTLLLAMGKWWDREREIVVRKGARLRVGDDDGNVFRATAGTELSPQSVPAMHGWSYDEPFPDRHSDFFELVENPHTDRGRETRVEESGSPPPEGGEGKPARGEPGQEGTLVRPMASARRKYPIVIDRNGWLDSKGKFTPVPENQAHLEVGEAEVRVICYPPMVEFDIQADSPRVREVVKEALRDNPNLQEVTIEIEGEEFEESMLPERAEELLDSYRWTPSLRRPMAAMDSPLLRAKAGVAEELGEPKASIDYRLFRLLPSPVHGTGVFADCDIPRGSHLDLFPSGERFVRNEDLPPGQQQTYDWFGVKDEAKGGYWVPPDMGNKDKGWYLNHSGHPNAASKTPGGQLYAARDIKREEEILIDYASLGPGNLTKEAADLSLFAGVSSPAQLPSADEFAGRYGANRKASYGQLREFLSGLPSPLTVYRALKLPSRHPYTQGFGVCWSWDESGAIPYEGEDDWEPKLEVDAYDDSYEDRGGYRTYVFRGEVAPESVDWGRTVWANLGHPMEKEVTLRDRAPLRLTGWKRRHSTRWQRPVREHVTASSSAGEGTARAAAFEKTALNVPRLVQDFGRKLVERYEADFPQRPKGTTTPEAIVESLTLFDPTDNNEYTAWLAGSYARGELGKYQDLPEKVAPLLGRFHSLKKTKNLRPEDTNIQKVRGIAKLEALLAEYAEIEAASRRQRAQAMEQGFYRKKEATLLHDDGEVKVVVPHTKEASKFFGINTKWCTAAEENNAFEGYNEDGPLYIVLLKRENKRFQFHFPTAQFTDEQDRPLGVREWMRQHPKVAGILYPLSSDFRSSCEDCTGEGYRQCGRCEGTGHEQCGDCDGDGEERCSDCQGSGKQGEEGENCDSCEGKGYVTCETCNGGGNVSCGECEGTGRTECDSCGGSGTNPEMEEFIIGCEEAGVAPRTTHRRPPAPPRKQQPAGRWPELRRRVREWIEPRRTPVHVGPRGMAFLQWLEGVKRRLKGRGRRGASAKAAAALAFRKPALAYDISEAEACAKSWPRLDGLRPYALEEAFGSPVPSLLTIYHAGPTDIRPGVFVTTDRGYAEEFLEPGERIWEKKDIPLADFQAYGEGRIVGRNRHTGSEGVELIYNPLPKGRRPKTAAGEWWRRWRKTEVIPRGTVLYHGTAEDFPAGDLGFPAWFSTSRSVAEHFQSWHGGKYPRVLAYRALRPIRLPRIDSREEMEAFGEMFGMESVVEGYGAEEMAEDMLKSSLPGWILPHNYPDGDDILLAASDGIEFTGEEPEPRGGTEEEGEDRQGSAPPDPGDAGFFQTEYRGEGEWVQDPATGHYSYRKSPAEAEAWGKRQKAAGELASARATGGEQRLPASLAIFRGEGGSSRRGGHYWSPDREWAAQFTQSGRAEELLQAEIMAKDIYEPSPLPYAGDPEEVRAAVRQARKAGFRAVWLDEGAREPRSVYVFGGSALYRL